MFDVFLSHNSADKAAVEALAQRLEGREKLLPFLDKWHLVPGTPWQPAITQALEASKCVAVFIGPSGVSPWLNQELQLALANAARSRDEYRVIPVLLPGADPSAIPPLASLRTWVDYRGKEISDEATFQRLIAGIRGLPPASAASAEPFALPDEPSPYRDLRPFEQAHQQFFFGRERDSEKVLEKLGQGPCVAIIGASGVGKSSLVLAGVLPRLEERFGHAWPKPIHSLVFSPGMDPLLALATQVATLLPQVDRLRAANELAAMLRQGDRSGLRSALTAWMADRAGTVVLVVDQMEELLTHSPPGGSGVSDQETFAENLLDLIQRGGSRFKVLTTLRADFVERALQVRALKTLFQDHDLLLGPLEREDLRDAVRRPAEKVGALFETGLVNAILREIEQQPGALPLAQHLLYRLWKERSGVWLTAAVYERLGGVSGALDKHATAVFQRLSVEEQEIARRVFMRLTSLGEGVEDTRRRVVRTELYETGNEPGTVDRVLDHLSAPDARLLVAHHETIEVAHEVLIKHWAPFSQWVSQRREEIRAQRLLTVAASDWETHGREASYLFTGARLLQSEERFRNAKSLLNPLEVAFLEASVSERDAQKRAREEQRQAELNQARLLAEEAEARQKAESLRADDAARSSRRLRRALVAVGVVLMLAIASSIEAFRERALAQDALKKAGKVAQEVVFVIATKLEPVAGAGPVRRELMDKVAALQDSLGLTRANDADTVSTRIWTHLTAGDVALSHENVVAAKEEYQRALALAIEATASHPENARLRRDLSISYNKLGDVLRAGGDLKAARDSFQKALDLTASLVKDDPENAQLRRDLSVSYSRLGDVLQAGGDLKAARDSFQKALDLTIALAKGDPENAVLRKDLSYCYAQLGEVLRAQGDLKGAERMFQEAQHP